MSLRAVIIGGVSWNTLVFVDRFPDPVPQTVFADRMHRTLGASGAGKALNLRSLGVDASLWAMVGEDEEGRLVRERLADAGIEFLTTIDPAGTAQHVNLMDAAGERISIFGNAGSVDAVVDPEPMRTSMDAADLISVTIINHCRPFLPLAARATADVWIDIHDYDGENPHHDEFIEAADALVMSSVSLPAWRTFLEGRIEAGMSIGIATHGAAGASGITADHGWVEVPAAPAVPLDTNGAGDAFMAGFAVEWYRGHDLDTAMRAGAEHAARAVESLELAPPF